MNIIITFGQSHAHHVNGHTYDKDSVAVIECPSHEEGRKTAVELFGNVFCTSHTEEDFDKGGGIAWYPRGKVNVNPELR